MPPIARVGRKPRRESEGLTLPRPRLSSRALTSPFRRPSAPSTPGAAVERFGPYLVYEQLGAGGMASVHRAELVGVAGFRKQVALKRMRTELTADEDLIDAFVREAQLASKLRHPNIAQAYELGRQDGTYFIAMELVPGPTLAQVMRQSRHAVGPIPLPIVVEILIQLCDALEAVHDLRDPGGRPLELIHRDVTPANIIVSRTGTVKLIDFGIAKHRAGRHTQTGIIKGKHAYLAPEYTYGALDHRADLFALGIVAHELLTGRRLFLMENDMATIRAVRELEVQPPSFYDRRVPAELDAIVMTALARDPAQRWQNAGAIRVALTNLMRELGMRVRGRDLRDWIEWAFQQPDHEPSGTARIDVPSVSIVIEPGVIEPGVIEPGVIEPLVVEDEPDEDAIATIAVDPPSRRARTVRLTRRHVPAPAPIGAALLARRRRRTGPLAVVMLGLAVAVLAGLASFHALG